MTANLRKIAFLGFFLLLGGMVGTSASASVLASASSISSEIAQSSGVTTKVTPIPDRLATDSVLLQEVTTGVDSTGAENSATIPQAEKFNVKEFIQNHVADSYQWHITTIGDHHISVYLPVILYSKSSGWHVFSSAYFAHDATYKGFFIAQEGQHAGRVVELDATGAQIRPFDISITKNSFALLLNSFILIVLILGVARWYKKRPADSSEAPSGFVGAMELFIMDIHDEVIKKCVGKDYARYAPYLLTAFFFILINNLMGLIPIFPAGANTTGNMAITIVLAMCTFLIVNIFASKEYWREILWPDVPLWLKVPIPLMPMIEFFGIFTKPFALMVRLFANIMAGHSIILGLTCLIFVTYSMGATINSSMTVLSVIMTLFMNFVELLVAYIQAYVFTMLSAVFIGLSRVEPHKAH